MNEITSSKNEKVKKIKQLSKKKYRDESQMYVIEGTHLIEEAIRAHVTILDLVQSSSKVKLHEELIEQIEDANVFVVSDQIFDTLSDVPTPQGILAVAKIECVKLKNNFSGRYLLLDRVQDPGNVGTMIRTAAAADFSGVVLGDGCADLYSPKVVRAMQGMQFHIPIYSENIEHCLKKFVENKCPVYGTELNQSAIDYHLIQFPSSFGIVMGSEGQGVSQEILDLCNELIYIPMSSKVESLNVAVAAGILMFAAK